MPIDYEQEADRYDSTRGGEARAQAAAEAVLSLLPTRRGRLADVGGGTGIVSARLADAGLDVTVIDRSPAMLSRASQRLPGRCVLAPAEQLPFADESFDVVTCIWLLHLVADSAPVLDEIARVLRPGGLFVTTVDKAAAQGASRDRPAQDATEVITAWGAEHHFTRHGHARFVGLGQEGDPTYTVLSMMKMPGHS